MYTQEDLTSIRLQQRNCWLKLMIPGVILLAGIIVSLIVRIEWLTTVLSCILGCMILFTVEMIIKPLYCYEKHLDGCLNGRRHELEGTFIGMEEEVSLVDGVRYRGLTVHDDNPETNYERLFYFDLEKPFPDVKEGDKVHVVYHGHELVDLARI